MHFKDLECFELLRLQQGKENRVNYPDGKACFIRNGNHSDFFYDNGFKAAELDLIGKSAFLGATYALNAWYKNGARQLQATGFQNRLPGWYNYYRDSGQRQMFVSGHLERHWDVHGNTTACRVFVNGEWNNLLALAKQVNPNSSQQTLNKVINELIYTMRGKAMLPPYDSEYDFKVRKNRMMKLALNYKSK